MDRFKVIEVLYANNADMTLRDALKIIRELEDIQKDAGETQLLKNAAEWARWNFSKWDQQNRRIQAVKVLRTQFPGLALKDGVDIINGMVSKTYANYKFE